MRLAISWKKLLVTVVIGALVAIWLYPVVLSVITSLKTTQEIDRSPFALPKPIYLGAYVRAWQVVNFGGLLLNSTIYGLFGSLLALVLGILPAYAFTRFRIPGGSILFVMILTTLMLPQQTVIIPLYGLMTKLGLLNTRIGLIIIHGVYGMAFELLILSGFVSTIPRDLEMSARIDGCGDFAVLRYIVLPLSIPAAIVGCTLNFIDIWKEFFFALIFLSNQSVMPVTLGLLVLRGTNYFTSTNLPAAGVILSQLPIVALYAIAHRKMSTGIFVGSLKE